MSEPPAPIAPPVASYASRGGMVFLGILMMLTFVFPMSVSSTGDKATFTWSWDLLKQYSSLPDAVKPLMNFLIAAWGIGLLCVIFASAMRNLPLAIGYVLLATAGWVAAGLVTGGQGNWVPNSKAVLFSPRLTGIDPQMQQVLFLSVMGGFLLITGLRSRVVRAKLLCILQLPLSLGLAAGMGLLAWDRIDLLRAMPVEAQSLAWWDAVTPVVLLGLLVLSGVIAFFHAFAMSSPYGGTTRGARRMSVVAILSMLAIPLLMAVAKDAQKRGGKAVLESLPVWGGVILVVGLLLLSLEAVTALLASILGFVWPAPLESMPAGTAMGPAANQLSERLQRLDYLRSQGAISAEEYAAQRKRLLDQL